MNLGPKSTSLSRPDGRTLLAYMLGVIATGANAVAVRFTVAELRPFWGASLRFGAAALIFWIIILIRRTALPAGRAVPRILLYGALNFGIGYAFIYWGLKSIPASLAQVVLALVPLLTFFFAFFHGLEAFRWRGLAGAVIAVGGIAWAFFERPGQPLLLPGLLAIVAGAACFAESIVLLKRLPRHDPLVINALSMTTGTAILLLLSLVFGETRKLPVMLPTWMSIAYLVLIGSVVVFYLFVFVVERWTASATSYQFVLFPFFTVLIAAWIAGESVNAAFLLGGALVLIGVWFGAFSAAPRPMAPRTALTSPTEGD